MSPLPATLEDGGFLGGVSLDVLLRLFLRHGFWVLLCMVIGPALASLWLNRQVRWYRAEATIVYDWSQPAALGRRVDVFDPYTDFFNKQELMETEFRIIASQRVLRQVVTDSGLDIDRAFLEANFPGTQPGHVKAEQLIDLLKSRLKVQGVKGTSIANISYEDTDPQRAQRLVTAIIDTYIRVSNEDTVGITGNALAWLREQVQKLQQDLEGSESELHRFKKERNLLSVSLNDQNNLLRSEIGSIQTAVTQVNIKRAQLVSRANALAKVTRANPDDLPASELMNDPVLTQLRNDFLKARAELTQHKTAGKLENHPDIQQAQAQLDNSLEAFIRQVRNIQGAALREAAVVSSEAAALQALLEDAKKRALDLNMEEIKYNQLQRATSTNEKLYTNMLERMKEVDLSRMINTKNIKPLDPARLPTVPIRPVVGNILAIGAGIGFFVGLLIAVLRELADRTIRTPTDLEQKLGLSCLGLLPAFEGILGSQRPGKRRNQINPDIADKPELVVARQPMSMVAEAARSIRSNITFMSPDRPPRLLLVTSASPSEGKTTTAATLAATFAQANARTLIVDLDLRRPRLHKIFDIGPEHGITSVMLGEETLDEAIQPTSVPNLSVLPAGRTPPNPAELLMSDRLMELLHQLRDRFDRVIIDSPPTNPVTDAVILSTRVDGTVFVVRSYSTTIDQVRHSLRAIRGVQGKLLGVILNVVDLRRLEYKYSYNYRYYSGYGEYSQAAPKAP
ncbi:MAG: polysaccharide biosynthesis tyrosine autokinase [Myxococcales bacterium]|nr:polysaccharide biosynthesis tyrosine autokinase [Polyangiaceae bacterium]MDW8250483.1 polysaccharide biosynthesis tyrosine autokinase [Myxococcales bacterium]